MFESAGKILIRIQKWRTYPYTHTRTMVMVIIIMIIIKTHSHCYILVKLYLGVLKQDLVYVLMETSIEPCVCYCKLCLLDTQGRGVACRRLITTSSAAQIAHMD